MRMKNETSQTDQQIKLREKQFQEKKDLMDKFFIEIDSALGKNILDPESHALAKFNRVKQREKDNKLREIEFNKRAAMKDTESEIEKRYDGYEDLIRKQRDDEKVLLAKKEKIKKLIDAKKNLMQERINMFTPEQREIVLRKYEKEIRELERTMDSEKTRQTLTMQRKMEEKRKLQDRIKMQSDKKFQLMKNMFLDMALEHVLGSHLDETSILARMLREWREKQMKLREMLPTPRTQIGRKGILLPQGHNFTSGITNISPELQLELIERVKRLEIALKDLWRLKVVPMESALSEVKDSYK